MDSLLQPAAENQDLVVSLDYFPINSLPLEILPLIFIEALHDSEVKSSTILIISRVCHHWRTVALSSPELWAWIDSADPGIIQTMMVRAKNRPLSIVLKHLYVDNRQPIYMVLKSLHNIQSLSLSIIDESGWDKMDMFLEMENSAPILETLFLSCYNLPQRLFGGSLPSLQRLHLDSYDTEWPNLPDCPRLRALCLSHPSLEVQVPDFMAHISKLPQLEELEAVNFFTYGSGARLQASIELPHLKYLRLCHSYTGDIISILNHLRIPSTCKIRVDVNRSQPNHYLALLQALSTCRTGPLNTIRKLKFVASSWLDVTIHEANQREARIYPTADPFSSYPNLTLRIWLEISERGSGHSIQMVTDICQNRLNLSHLESIDLRALDSKRAPSNSFWEFIDSLSSLRVLKVRQGYTKAFVEYLSAAMPSADSEGFFLPFGKIHKLVYEDLNEDVDGYLSRLAGLVQYLRVRANREMRLTTLSFVHAERSQDMIPSDVLDDLGGLVCQVKRKVKGYPRYQT